MASGMNNIQKHNYVTKIQSFIDQQGVQAIINLTVSLKTRESAYFYYQGGVLIKPTYKDIVEISWPGPWLFGIHDCLFIVVWTDIIRPSVSTVADDLPAIPPFDKILWLGGVLPFNCNNVMRRQYKKTMWNFSIFMPPFSVPDPLRKEPKPFTCQGIYHNITGISGSRYVLIHIPAITRYDIIPQFTSGEAL